ncbi:hypothetical protein [Paenibacillus sp. FSL H3-0286]|uniref:hypothetical protein n=1 Tax=Paenibacillus sp. FSL H3-0286 TaxID=2921427 RepID=UPI0032445AF9
MSENEVRLRSEKIENRAREKFGYRKTYIDGELFRYRENFRDSTIDELVKEFIELKPIIDKTKPRFLFIKEALIIRHFTLYGFENLKFARKADIEHLICNTNDLYDTTLENEEVKYLDKIMSLFDCSEIKKVEKRLDEIAV